MTDEAFPDALPAGYRLHWYTIEHVLGQGGFGITHLARDTNLDRLVAIKEYLPVDFGRRRPDATVMPRTEASAERYAWGLERFLAEARTLARFDHPNIVRVMSVFEANNTAYMVMRFEEGQDLATLLDGCGTVSERQLLDCLLPILEGLQLVHEAGYIHRDIKPENIYVRADGSPVLLDFGSARQSFGMARTMTVLLAPGYAPLEQYYGTADSQGAWTDIYGLGATCYRAITGRAPLDAVARAKGVLGSAREMLPLATDVGRGRYNHHLLAAIDHALQLAEADRPQTVADWRREILAALAREPDAAAAGGSAPPLASAWPGRAPAPADPQREMPAETPGGPGPRKHRARLLSGFGVTVAVTAVAVYVFVAPPRTRVRDPVATTTAGSAPAAPAPSAVTVAERPREEPVPPAVAPPASAAASIASKVAALVANAADRSAPRDARATARPSAVAPAPPLPREVPAASTTLATSAAPVVASEPVPALAPPAAPVASAAAAPAAPSAVAAAHRSLDDQLDAADAALRGGDLAAATRMLTPLATAGIPRAQALLGRVKEAGRDQQRNAFEAYVWYSMAARNGEPGAQALRDRIAGTLQPAEIRQADQLIERWKPHHETTEGATN